MDKNLNETYDFVEFRKGRTGQEAEIIGSGVIGSVGVENQVVGSGERLSSKEMKFGKRVEDGDIVSSGEALNGSKITSGAEILSGSKMMGGENMFRGDEMTGSGGMEKGEEKLGASGIGSMNLDNQKMAKVRVDGQEMMMGVVMDSPRAKIESNELGQQIEGMGDENWYEGAKNVEHKIKDEDPFLGFLEFEKLRKQMIGKDDDANASSAGKGVV